VENRHSDIIQVIHDYMSDPETAWRIGNVAEFVRDADEDVEIALDYSGGSIVGAHGAVRIAAVAGARLVPAEGLTARSWDQAGLLCLPEGDAPMSRRKMLTELGNDLMAGRPVDRLGTLFDLGLGDDSVDLCVRTANPELCAALRAKIGETLAEDDAFLRRLDDAGVDYVASSRLGRIETFGRRLVRLVPLAASPPAGQTACMAFVPPQQAADGEFDEATYGAFRVLYGIFGDPSLVRLKESVAEAVRGGAEPGSIAAEGPEAKTAVAVTLRQIERRDGASDLLARWRASFDL